MKFYLTFFVLIHYLFLTFTHCHVEPTVDYRETVHKKCNHAKKDFKKYFLSGLSSRKKANSYYNEVKFEKMRMHFDYTYTLPYEEKLLKELVIPPVKLFFENALKVRRFPGNIRFPSYVPSCQEVPIPSHLRSEGADADIVIIISTYRGMKKFQYENSTNKQGQQIKKSNNEQRMRKPQFNSLNAYLEKYFRGKNFGNGTTLPWEINDAPKDVVGWSFLCMQDLYTLRPLAGVMQYVADINPTQRSIEEAVWTTLHEITHVLVMDYDLYYDFIDNDFNRIGYSNTLLIKSKIKGLQKFIDERQDVMDDIVAFGEFNSTISNEKNRTLLRKSKAGNNNFTGINITEEDFGPFNNSFVFDLASLLSSFHPSTTLPVMDEYEEIKIPSKFNFTTIILYIRNFLENSKIFIKTPKVVELARQHFGCPSLKGLELEHFGSIGSALSHWGKRILNTEYMIADSYGENYISHMTLALMEDSGWYQVDYSKAEAIPWGRKKGCEFLDEKCIQQKKSKAKFFSVMSNNGTSIQPISLQSSYDSNFKEEFCTSFEEEKCSISHVFRAICAINTYFSDIPKQYQYFGTSNIGGPVNFGDYCPYPIEWFEPSSMSPMGSCRNGIRLRQDLGEKVCENCRCFHSSLIEDKTYSNLNKIIKSKSNNNTIAKYPHIDDTRAACYEAKCTLDTQGRQTLIIIINDIEIICPRGGAILTIDGYKGTIECPKAEAVCFGTLDKKLEMANSSGYNLFSHLSEKLLSILYDFITSFFSSK